MPAALASRDRSRLASGTGPTYRFRTSHATGLRVLYDDDELVHHCLARLSVSADDRARLDDALAELLPRHRVRTLGGFMLVDALAETHPALAADGAELLTGRRRMATNSFAAALAFYAYLGNRHFPDLPLSDATNACATLAAAHNRASPMVQIMLKATGGSWTEFLAGIDTWSRILGQARIDFEVEADVLRSITRGRIALAFSYFQLGYVRGLARFFDRETEHRWIERAPRYIELELRWRS